MQSIGFPRFNEHKAIHTRLVDNIGTYAERIKGGDGSALIDLMIFLQEWLTGHIQVEDRVYAEFSKNKHLLE